MKNLFVTITGINNYYGMKPFEIGRIVKLVKEPDNPYDKDAISVNLPFIDKIGYVANSVNTVYGGTLSAGRLWDKIDDEAFAQVMFTTHSSVIAIVKPPESTSPSENSYDTIHQISEDKTITESLTPPSEPLNKIGF